MEQKLYEERVAICKRALKEGKDLDEPMVFYSTGASSFTLGVNPGKYVLGVGGQNERIGQKIVEFLRIEHCVKQSDGSGKYYGNAAVTDPEVALALLDRCQNPKLADIVMGEEYKELVTPAEQRLEEERTRGIHARNELEQHLEAERQRVAKLEEENLRLRALAEAKAQKNVEKELVGKN